MDYKSTLFLPRTSFQMKAGLPRKEPEYLDRWRRMEIYRKLRRDSQGRDKFTLHDGPPYANGHLHIGHALNKILKDMIVRCRQMLGFNASYVPGWDCHGLPIEWKIEEQYRKAGKDKDQVPVVQFRQECREFADKWIDLQREEFKRLGITGDWDNPYTTMTFAAEAQIVRELGKFLIDGSLYRGAKPVLWSVVEKTALAEAEVEYHDHTSTTIYAKFPVLKSAIKELENASVVIWTTTPWTIPGNRAVAYGPDIEYVVVQAMELEEGSLAQNAEKFVVALDLLESFQQAAGIRATYAATTFKGADLEGTICRHPFAGRGYDFEVPVLAADFVEVETGTGFVHIAPGHGADDWELGIKNNIPVPDTVGGDGLFFDDVPLFAGKHVFKVNPEVVEALKDCGALLSCGKLSHSYPHSWRSKAPLIFRNTAQWFISMEKTGIREAALDAIGDTAFYPASGKTRLRSMIETRPDWCVSRQRAWGVPITVFVDRKTQQPLRDEAVFERIVKAVEEEGADAWFTSEPSRFLGDEYDPDDFEKVTDILDVWFDSGCTHSYVLEARDDLDWPADLYLEGSDQHRGWFHSSLLESCGTRGRAPYRAVLTHGFVMGADGQKMSKSLGNIVSPQDVVSQYGADILRLWVVGSDYSEDLRIGPEILKQHADIYRRLRNTLRFLLGNLNDFCQDERLDISEMPELERWVLHRVWELDKNIRQACEEFNFHPLFAELHNFCAIDLSAFYFDIRKDSLYCDRADNKARRAARTVLDTLFDCLTAWLAPFICFTAEEAWLTRNPGDNDSVHLHLFPEIPEKWRDDELAEKWKTVRDVRRVVTRALEVERAEKRIGSSLQANPVIYADEKYRQAMTGIDLSELFITSGARLENGDGLSVTVQNAEGEKCQRCWKLTDDMGLDPEHPEICRRCTDVVRNIPKADV